MTDGPTLFEGYLLDYIADGPGDAAAEDPKGHPFEPVEAPGRGRRMVTEYLVFAVIHLVCQGLLPYTIERLLSPPGQAALTGSLKIDLGLGIGNIMDRSTIMARVGFVLVVMSMLLVCESMARQKQWAIIPDLEAYMRLRLTRDIVATGAFVDHHRLQAQQEGGAVGVEAHGGRESGTVVARIGSLCSDVCAAVVSHVEGILDTSRLLVTSLFVVARAPKYVVWGVLAMAGMAGIFQATPKCESVTDLGERTHFHNLGALDEIYRHLPTVYLHQQEGAEVDAYARHTAVMRAVGTGWRACELNLARLGTLWYLAMVIVLTKMQYDDYRAGRANLALLGVTLTYANYLANVMHPWIESMARSRRLLSHIRTQEVFFTALLEKGREEGAEAGSGLVPGSFPGLALDGVDLRASPDGAYLLRGCSWRVPAGRRVALLGPNGSGKSQLLWALLGWRRSTFRGRVAWQGSPVDLATADGLRAWRGRISFLDQSAEVMELRTAGANRTYGSRGRSKTAAAESADDRAASTLSGGQRQSLLMSRVLEQSRELVFMDEPHAALGPSELDRFLDRVAMLPASSTVVMVTHSLRVALAMDDAYLLDTRTRSIRGPLSEPEVRAFFDGAVGSGARAEEHEGEQEFE